MTHRVHRAAPASSPDRAAVPAAPPRRPADPGPPSPPSCWASGSWSASPARPRPAAAARRPRRRGRLGDPVRRRTSCSRSQTLALTGALQRAARAGGNPKLLIATDQEGGEVKRVPSGPPTLAPPEMVATGTLWPPPTTQGRATGSALRRWGINMDLAPVADVPTFGGAFIWRQGRAFSFNAATVARYATAFALGLQSRGVAADRQALPGTGLGHRSTPTSSTRSCTRPRPSARPR